MSSDKMSEKLVRRKLKVSWGRLIRPGLVGPKPRPKGVGDGQQVNIPVPPVGVEARGERRRVAQPGDGRPVQARRRASYDEKVRPLRREVMTWPQG